MATKEISFGSYGPYLYDDAEFSDLTVDAYTYNFPRSATPGYLYNDGTGNLVAQTPSTATHASTHIKDGSDEIDGDRLDIDFTPTNYSPDSSLAEAGNVDHLAAHLKGIDSALSSGGGFDYALAQVFGY